MNKPNLLQQGVTSLQVSKTATGFNEVIQEFDWTIQKTPVSSSVVIPPGESGNVSFTLSITRNLVSETQRFGARGIITVTNTGENPTVGLMLNDVVQYKLPGPGMYQPLPTQVIFIAPIPPTPPGELPAGATGTYVYEVEFVLVPNATYRNEAQVTIQNHPEGTRTFIYRADFSLPTEPTIIQRDANVVLSDVVTFPAGFTGNQPENQFLTSPPANPIILTVPVTNASAICGQELTLSNQATLTESNSGSTRVSNADVTINTGECPTVCPLSMGYWKTHYPDSWPQTVRALGLKIGQIQYSAYQLEQTLNLPSQGDASLILAHQLIAAKINIANGAEPSPVAETIALGDALLYAASPCQTDYNPMCQVPYGVPPSSTSGGKMVSAALILDAYNRSQMTPGCPAEPPADEL